MSYILIVWLAAASPAATHSLPFGPFDSAADCEKVFAKVSSYYIGTEKLKHACSPRQSAQ